MRVALATAPSSCSNSFFIIHLGHFLNLLQHTNSADEATFLEGSRDYYGIDIDRADRLKGGDIEPKLKEREVIIDREMYRRVMDSYNRIGNKDDFSSVLKLHGPTSHMAKGIPDAIEIYRALNEKYDTNC